jgi:hypothetical protein
MKIADLETIDIQSINTRISQLNDLNKSGDITVIQLKELDSLKILQTFVSNKDQFILQIYNEGYNNGSVNAPFDKTFTNFKNVTII